MSVSRTDVFGAALSSTDDASIEAFNRAAGLLLAYDPDPLEVLDAAIVDDSGFIMGRCLRAGIHLIASDQRYQPRMLEDLEVLRSIAVRANDRELRHIEALSCWAQGDRAAASVVYADLLLEYPRDLCALQIGHQIDFLLGTAGLMRDRPARILRHWGQADPHYPYVLGMLAFGLEEANHYAEAERTARRCLELNPRDTWGTHALAHCLEMQGRTDEGVQFLSGTEVSWHRPNALAIHNRWHLALYYLEQGDFARALALHDRYMIVTRQSALMDMHDSAALLWRLRLHGVPLGDRWSAVADRYEEVTEQAYFAFTDLHAALAFAATEREGSLLAVVGALEAGGSAAGLRGIAIRAAGLPAVRGIHAFSRGDYAEAKRFLSVARPWSHLIGGSVAQRDILNLTLIEIAIRTQDRALLEGLIAERTRLKPSSPLIESLWSRLDHEHS
jgi:tetratricopeptide (TPR) repeat protein